MSRHLKTAPINKPVAGADWSWVASGRDLIEVVAVVGRLTTSATVAARVPALQIISQDNAVVYYTAPSVSQAASLADYWQYDVDYQGAATAGLYATGASVNTVGIPRLWLPHLWTLRAKTFLIDTTDQWDNLQVLYYEHTDYSEGEIGALLAQRS